MPSGLIHEQHSVGIWGDGLRDFGKVQVHRLGVAKGQNKPGACALARADRAEDIGRGGALVMRRAGARTPLCPTPRDLVLLANPSLVLEPDLYRGSARKTGPDLCQFGCKAPFLNASSAAPSWAWWRGRADSFT